MMTESLWMSVLLRKAFLRDEKFVGRETRIGRVVMRIKN